MNFNLNNAQSYHDFLLDYTNLYENDLEVLEACANELGTSLMELFVNAREAYYEDKRNDYTLNSDVIIQYMMEQYRDTLYPVFEEMNDDELEEYNEEQEYKFDLVNKASIIINRVFYEPM